MRRRHIITGMLERIRTLMIVIDEGSVNRAAARLRISQPALSRQVQWLEREFGGKLLERESSGVKPTGLGHSLIKSMTPVLRAYDAALVAARRQARGQLSEVRVGYLISAAQAVLAPALESLRLSHPGVRMRLFDMSPREQIAALRAGEVDVALTGQEGLVAARDFHSLTLCSLGVCVALAMRDPLAARENLMLRDLKAHDFLGVDEHEMPGRNPWIAALCRKAGFKPRFIGSVDGVTHLLSRVASDTCVTLLPDYFLDSGHPGVLFRAVRDTHARWDFILLRQKGRMTPAMRASVEALQRSAEGLR